MTDRPADQPRVAAPDSEFREAYERLMSAITGRNRATIRCLDLSTVLDRLHRLEDECHSEIIKIAPAVPRVAAVLPDTPPPHVVCYHCGHPMSAATEGCHAAAAPSGLPAGQLHIGVLRAAFAAPAAPLADAGKMIPADVLEGLREKVLADKIFNSGGYPRLSARITALFDAALAGEKSALPESAKTHG